MRYYKINVTMLGLLILLCLGNITGVEAQESGQKKYGVVYNIAEDRKIEKVGGIYEPEGLDKYVKRRFDEVDGKLIQLEQSMADLKEELLQAIQEMNKKKPSILVS